MAENIGERHILIAVDETENGERAVLYVADILGGLPGFRTTVLHIIPEPPEDFFPSEAEAARWRQDRTQRGEELVARYKTLLEHAGFPEEKVATEVLVKPCTSLSDCIVEEVERLGACTVAVGRRGLTSKEEFLEGSTSSHLLHIARNCAVWVVE